MSGRNRRIYAVISCDTEFLPPWYEGSWENMATWSLEKGLPFFCDVINENGIKGTFFTQATAAEKFPETIQRLAQDGHLIGSHGYNHENYGNSQPQVWTPEKPVFLDDTKKKKELLDKAHAILSRVAGYEPEVFVAPFDMVSIDLLEVLDDMNYKVDSSFHNYSRGLNSFPFRPVETLDIIEIPLTVLDFGKFGRKNILEAFAFNSDWASDKLAEYLEESVDRYPFSVVFITCHPYEFLEIKIPHPEEILIVGEKKISSLHKLIGLLRREGIEFRDPLEIGNLFLKLEKKKCYETRRSG